MKRLQWLAEAEIRRLEELYSLPSPDEVEAPDETEELRTEARKVRPGRRRER